MSREYPREHHSRSRGESRGGDLRGGDSRGGGGGDMSRTRVYVGGLTSAVRQRDVERAFSRYGRVEDVTVKHDFGFVEFRDAQDARDAVRHLDNSDLQGNRIVVQHAKGRPRLPGAKEKCFNCGKDGHWARDCREGDWSNRCYQCGGRGHIQRTCPKGSSVGGGSSSNGGGGSSRSSRRSYSRSPSRSPRRSRRSPSPRRSRRSPSRSASRSPPRERRQRARSRSNSRSASRSPRVSRRASRSMSRSPARGRASNSPPGSHTNGASDMPVDGGAAASGNESAEE